MDQACFVTVGRVDELAPGTSRVVAVGEHAVLLVNLDDTLYAVPNACPHRGWPLAQAELCEATLKCARHGWEFDVPSGRATYPPFGYQLHQLPVRVVDQVVQVAWVEPMIEPAH